MMVDEQDSIRTFILPLSEENDYHYSHTTIVFLILFIILVPILLTNLLVSPLSDWNESAVRLIKNLVGI
jgi:hypothetical protein